MAPITLKKVRRGTAGAVLRRALECAIMDREALVSAYRNVEDREVPNDARREADEFRELSRQLFGDDSTSTEKMTRGGIAMTVHQIRKLAKEDPSAVNWITSPQI
jgi:hypothetical protein